MGLSLAFKWLNLFIDLKNTNGGGGVEGVKYRNLKNDKNNQFWMLFHYLHTVEVKKSRLLLVIT
jgi:hypothetical protein